MKKYILLVFLLTIFLDSKSQVSKEISLHKISGTKKIIKLNDELFFDVIKDRDSIKNNENVFLYNGQVANVSKDSITIYSESFTERIIRNNDVKKEINIDRLIYDSIETLPVVSFCKRDIYHIEKSNTKGMNFYLGMGFISLFSGLVVAPLISINYKNGEFKEKIYYYTASISVAFSILNFSLVPTTTHKYWLKNYYKNKKKWNIE